jgi:hypothetical protein
VGHIPEGTEWFLAELVMEITVWGATHNVVHRNLILVRAGTAEEAHQRATYWGRQGESTYHNPAGQVVEFKFRGISQLDSIIGDIEDGAEIAWKEFQGVPTDELKRWIPPLEQLAVFMPSPLFAARDPDYSSKDVVDRLAKELGIKVRGQSDPS